MTAQEKAEVTKALVFHVGLLWERLIADGRVQQSQFLDTMRVAAENASGIEKDVAQAFVNGGFIASDVAHHPHLKRR